MNVGTDTLKELLVRPGHVSEPDFNSAKHDADAHKKNLQDVLIEKDLIKDEQLGQLLAYYAGVPFVRLGNERIDDAVLVMIPESVARSRGVIAFGADAQGIKVAMTSPTDVETIHFIEKRLGQKPLIYYVTERDIAEALGRYRASIQSAFDQIFSELKGNALSPETRDETTVKLVDMLLRHGYQSKASDIHMEPYAKKIVIRFRIDGVMHDVLEVPKELEDVMLTRIKILAKLRTDEHRAAQDGKLNFESDGEKVDVRVSIVPVTEGENLVMRLLSAKNRQLSLTDLGLSQRDLDRVLRSIDNPHGMILVTGPTGSGKTTTVYGMLKILNIRDVHIETIEDPVEYEIEGVSQIQVNVRTNLTFAKGLRAIVRQDPDIIMVGEIRDEETAEIAINSAMTGHLVLSTLHANDAATTLPRLLDMGVEPFLVASTVNVVIAQRLVRKICEKCRASHALTETERKIIESDAHLAALVKEIGSALFYTGVGCSACGNTGYAGRIGIFEVLEMTDAIKVLVTKRASSGEIMEAARQAGMTTMMHDGVDKVTRGITTIEEVARATKE